ncbi:hypothetical protein, partial [Mesorhizobium sp. M0047]|uniref:hypothetical protein n=1 Tax=Mesorhizobium sp. M0047 TaxID=2956859 RepID=UPI00333CA7D2
NGYDRRVALEPIFGNKGVETAAVADMRESTPGTSLLDAGAIGRPVAPLGAIRRGAVNLDQRANGSILFVPVLAIQREV